MRMGKHANGDTPAYRWRPELFGYAGAMPRQARSVSAARDVIYHVMNRGNCRMDFFQRPGDFAAFVTVLEEGRQRVKMRILP
jgi:hypothetical protein